MLSKMKNCINLFVIFFLREENMKEMLKHVLPHTERNFNIMSFSQFLFGVIINTILPTFFKTTILQNFIWRRPSKGN